MQFSIRQKLFVLLAGFTAAILAGVLSMVTNSLSGAILKKVQHDFLQTQQTFQREQGLRYENLLNLAGLIGENPAFKANVSLASTTQVSESNRAEVAASVRYIVSDLARLAPVDLFIVTDAEGQVLADLTEAYDAPQNMSLDALLLEQRPSVIRALPQARLGSGQASPNSARDDLDPAQAQWPELWHLPSGLYQVATVSIWTNDDTIIGTLTLGLRFDKRQAVALKGNSDIDITLKVGNELVATTVEDLHMTDVLKFQESAMYEVDDVITKLATSDVFEGLYVDEEVFAFLSPLGIGEPAYLLATAVKSRELAILDAIRGNIFLTAGVSLLVTLLLAQVLGRRLTQPLQHLVAGMDQVKDGDLQVQLTPTTHDEIAALMVSFNDMIINLRERLQLMKYVGSYTREMIQSSAGEEADLGGSRHQLAVLFTDIRGFTAYSEKREPEEVISMLNRYLGFQAEIVPQHEGSVDKFVGDEMMALFTGAEALDHAVACALHIMQRIDEEHTHDPVPLHIGVGINYGPATLGNMGASDRMDYTAIGATVNLGARLMQVAKPGQILLPESLLAQLGDSVPVKGIEVMNFKGISEALRVAELETKA
ncbi:MAG: HAMP domain-containing protein [Gemmatimonadetes bacterium]|jgi:class 3 adenylate cyclase|nr:HAMP domain-containing protein [Gemmatimonadota bacterium]MBT7861116.1 HAMP domain-containing protein [Gemmatimonadota bacterium]